MTCCELFTVSMRVNNSIGVHRREVRTVCLCNCNAGTANGHGKVATRPAGCQEILVGDM